ncbi:MAG: AMP-binding protein [Acidobacteria bacterium]|nr:AMP-binding protein [Acidobacteriota bacterium]
MKETPPGNRLNRTVIAGLHRLLRLRYRLAVSGMDDVRRRGRTGILFLPNHPALVDPLIVFTTLYPHFTPRPLAEQSQVDYPFIRWCARRIDTLTIPDVNVVGRGAREKVLASLNTIATDLRQGRNILMYPAGGILRSRLEDLGGRSGVEVILRQVPDVRVVLVRTTGLWGSALSWATGRKPSFFGVLGKVLRALLLSGIFFIPRREVRIRLEEPDDFPRRGDRAAINRYLEGFYNAEASPRTYVPYTPWERGGTRILPEPARGADDVAGSGDERAVLRQEILEYLAATTGVEGIGENHHLGRDLGLDSLDRAEMLAWLEERHRVRVTDAEALQKVGDLLAAMESGAGPREPELQPLPPGWFAEAEPDKVMKFPDGETVTEVFLRTAGRQLGKVIVADQVSGARTYRDLLTAIFVLQRPIRAIEGPYIGIMLPAGVAAVIAYLAVLFAGRIPVLINWTVGRRNVRHGVEMLAVRGILSARALLDRLAESGLEFPELAGRFVFLDRLRDDISLLRKVGAALRARFAWRGLRRRPVADIAAVLFTSGSESTPKAVPLTHVNLLQNVRDVLQRITGYAGDRMLGILPPFHSFGLTGTLLLPVCGGVPVVYHANPTESARLARIARASRATALLGTPSFLRGMARAALPDDLRYLRLAVTGAEKCPPAVYRLLQKRCPDLMVLEGYGVTECSPVISINDENDPRPGTIGRVLSSFDYVILREDRSEPAEPGQPGRLLVRGPCVFPGYLQYDGPSPFVQYAGRTWYSTGDLVREDEADILTFCGRRRRFVKIAGEMISLPAVENALAEAFAAELPDETVLAVEAREAEPYPHLVLFAVHDLDRAAVNEAIRAAGLSGLHHIREIHQIDAIPLLGTGKTDYRHLREMLTGEGTMPPTPPTDETVGD